MVELVAIEILIHNEEENLRGTDVVLFVDNSVAISAFIKGRSGNADLDAMAQRIHLHCYRIDVRIWVEYVESDSNWADGTSREGLAGRWAATNNFTCRLVEVPAL